MNHVAGNVFNRKHVLTTNLSCIYLGRLKRYVRVRFLIQYYGEENKQNYTNTKYISPIP